MPSFTFVSTANWFALRGAVPVFVDVRPDTLNIDETLIEREVTPRTRAIAVVHYGGIAAEMDSITDIADRHGLAVVEDNAHGLGGLYKDRALGVPRLHGSPELPFDQERPVRRRRCSTSSPILACCRQPNRPRERDQPICIQKGRGRQVHVARPRIEFPSWGAAGRSLDCATGAFRSIQSGAGVGETRSESMAHRAAKHEVQTPQPPAYVQHPAHLYHLVLPNPATQQGMIKHLRGLGIMAVSHYVPLHNSPAGLRFGRPGSNCPVTESVSDRLIHCPSPDLTQSAVGRVVEA